MTPHDSNFFNGPAENWLHHDRWLREVARQLVRDAADADELVQEAWLAAVSLIGSSAEDLGSSFANYLFKPSQVRP